MKEHSRRLKMAIGASFKLSNIVFIREVSEQMGVQQTGFTRKECRRSVIHAHTYLCICVYQHIFIDAYIMLHTYPYIHIPLDVPVLLVLTLPEVM